MGDGILEIVARDWNCFCPFVAFDIIRSKLGRILIKRKISNISLGGGGGNGVHGRNVEMIAAGVIYKVSVIFYFISASNITQSKTVLVGRVD
jgi:hypothetical protein